MEAQITLGNPLICRSFSQKQSPKGRTNVYGGYDFGLNLNFPLSSRTCRIHRSRAFLRAFQDILELNFIRPRARLFFVGFCAFCSLPVGNRTFFSYYLKLDKLQELISASCFEKKNVCFPIRDLSKHLKLIFHFLSFFADQIK